jgi:hypothetical protein
MDEAEQAFFNEGLKRYGQAFAAVQSFREVALARIAAAFARQRWKRFSPRWKEAKEYRARNEAYLAGYLQGKAGGKVFELYLGLNWEKSQPAALWAGLTDESPTRTEFKPGAALVGRAARHPEWLDSLVLPLGEQVSFDDAADALLEAIDRQLR